MAAKLCPVRSDLDREPVAPTGLLGRGPLGIPVALAIGFRVEHPRGIHAAFEPDAARAGLQGSALASPGVTIAPGFDINYTLSTVMPREPLNLKAATAVGISMQPSRWRQVSNYFHAAPA